MRDALRLPIAMATAMVVGHVAYLSPTTLYLLAAFPVLLTWARYRWGAGLTALAFFLGPSAAIPAVLQNWVAGSGQPLGHLEIYGYPVLLALLLSLPFFLVNPSAPRHRRAVQMVVALILLTVPPLGFIAWINPLMLSAALYPGAGIAIGMLLGLAVVALLAARCWEATAPAAGRLALATLLVGGIAAQSIENTRTAALPPVGWYAVDTAYPPVLPTAEARDFRAALIEAQAKAFLEFPETRLLLFPESVLPDFDQADRPRLASLRRRLQDSGVTLTLGVTPRVGEERWRNQLVLLGHDDPRVIAEARIPAPVGNWHMGGTGVPLRGFASGLVEIEGTLAHVSICYEEFPLWAHLAADKAEVLVSVANLWMLTDSVLSYQRTAISSVARLTGKPLLRAENRLPSQRRASAPR